MKRAVFLDRDGVINRLVYNPETGQYESPYCVKDLVLYPYAARSLIKLQQRGYMLFLVSNQPGYAKGKTTLENIRSIHEEIHHYLTGNGIKFTGYYYCYHHPDGIVPEYALKCRCRKPGAYFLREAEIKFGLDLVNSWFIGDQDTDIFCGQAVQTRTILINNIHSAHKRGRSFPDYQVWDLLSATELLLKQPFK